MLQNLISFLERQSTGKAQKILRKRNFPSYVLRTAESRFRVGSVAQGLLVDGTVYFFIELFIFQITFGDFF